MLCLFNTFIFYFSDNNRVSHLLCLCNHRTSSWQLEENVFIVIEVLDHLVLAIIPGLEQIRLLQMEQTTIYHLLRRSTHVAPRRVVVRVSISN